MMVCIIFRIATFIRGGQGKVRVNGLRVERLEIGGDQGVGLRIKGGS